MVSLLPALITLVQMENFKNKHPHPLGGELHRSKPPRGVQWKRFIPANLTVKTDDGKGRNLNRKKKFFLNSVTAISHQVISILCGFIMPSFFLKYYGSATNGLVSSVTQCLGLISLAECGVGAVVQSALYKPLAKHDMKSVSEIVASSHRFFRRLAYLLMLYVAVLMLVYPLTVLDSFDYVFTLILIVVMSISTFAQYYIGMTYNLLLNADQIGFIQNIINGGSLIVNTILCVILMSKGASLQVVKLVTSGIFLVRPLLSAYIARKKYKLDRNIKIVGEPIKQKWNGMAQHVATVVLGKTDSVILTIFSTLENVSVYAIYHLVTNGVKLIISSFTNGLQPMLGNMLAKKEMDKLQQTFDSTEWFLHTLVTFVFSCTAALIVPFVEVYTLNVHDANYIVPFFGYLLTLAQAAYCIRLPYNSMVLAAGHYKQTQWSAIWEATINIGISVLLVFHHGLIGVAAGTFAAMAYRTVYLAFYLSKNILNRKIKHFIKHLAIDFCTVVALFSIIKLFSSFYSMGNTDYFAWIVLAFKVGITGALITVGINIIFYKDKIKKLVNTKLKGK